jgi:cytochrome c oxidase subunit 5b
LGDLHGVDVFDLNPIEMTRMGTLDDPISIYTLVR